MAYTTSELALIYDLRIKLGDTPTKVLTSSDVGSTAYIQGVPFVVATADIGKDVDDLTKQIWNDSEYYSNLSTSLALTFKGKRENFENLPLFEKAVLTISAQIVFTYELAYVSSRYTKYKMRDVDVQKTSPEEFISMAKALKDYLDSVLDEGSDSGEIGNTVRQAVIRRFDKMDATMKPEIYQPDVKVLEFFLTLNSSNQVVIDIPYSFIVDYHSHFIKRYGDDGENVVADYDTLKTEQYIDTEVVTGTYIYRVYVESVNGELYYKEKTIVVP